MWRWLRDSAGFSSPKDMPQFRQGSSLVETSGVLFGASAKAHRLVSEPRPLSTYTWSTKLELRRGPSALSGSTFASAHIGLRVCVDEVAQLVSECPCWSRGLTVMGCPREPWGFSSSVGLWPMEWAQFPRREQAQTRGVAPDARAGSVCGPGLCGQTSKNTNVARVCGLGYGSSDVQSVRRARRVLKRGRVGGSLSGLCLWILCP